MEELDVLGESAESEEETEETEQLQMPDYKSEILAIIRSNASPRVMQKELSDYHPKNAFNIERFLSTKLKIKPDDVYEVYEVPVYDEEAAAD